MNTLQELNDLRVAAGMTPLKTWKASKVALGLAIDKLREVAGPKLIEELKSPELQSREQMLTDHLPGDGSELENVTDKTVTLSDGKKVKPGHKVKSEGGITISTIAEELGIDAKVARAKLRRHNIKPSGAGWQQEDVVRIKAMLKTDQRKKK